MCTFIMLRIFLSVLSIMLLIVGLGTTIGYVVDRNQGLQLVPLTCTVANNSIVPSTCSSCSCSTGNCNQCQLTCFSGFVSFTYLYLGLVQSTGPILVMYQQKYEVDVQNYINQQYSLGTVTPCYLELSKVSQQVQLNQYVVDIQQLLIWSIILWVLGGLLLALWLTIEISRVKCVSFYKRFNIPNDSINTEYNV